MSVPPHRREGPTGQRELWFALLVTLTVMLVEAITGLMSGSLALLADAGHMLTDASALSLSLFAAWMAAKPATPRNTYGYYRTEILAALLNGVALWLMVVWISIRAVQRLHHPSVILVGPMVSAACFGLAANLLSSTILSRVRTANLN
ncbi:MAG: cation transporter, partial [Candidatus Omnitrophica bacterium]|nr:cation transporter [Candidatus Omnitrophota bacterium]